MTSNIDPTKPPAGHAYTADVRENFATAATEISDLQARVSNLEAMRVAPHDVRVSAAGALLNNAVSNGAVLQFDTIDIDSDGFAPNTSPFDHVRVPVGLDGVYILIGASSGSGNQGTTLGMGILLNGTQTFSETNQRISGPSSVSYTLDNGAIEILHLSAGDIVQLINNSVSPGPNAFTSTFMCLARLQ